MLSELLIQFSFKSDSFEPDSFESDSLNLTRLNRTRLNLKTLQVSAAEGELAEVRAEIERQQEVLAAVTAQQVVRVVSGMRFVLGLCFLTILICPNKLVSDRGSLQCERLRRNKRCACRECACRECVLCLESVFYHVDLPSL